MAISKTERVRRQKEWRKRNPDWIRGWKERNRDRMRAYSASYRERHREQVRERNRLAMRARRAADPEKYRAIMRAWNKANPEKVKAKLERMKLRWYGITPEQYQKMFKRQRGVCAICRKPEARGHALSVDHCHSTKKIRGLLCGNCNRGLGLFFDSTKALARAVEYLRR